MSGAAAPLPPPGFDPLIASSGDLRTYGLPPRPDPSGQPLLYAAFASVFSPPITFVPPDLRHRPPPFYVWSDQGRNLPIALTRRLDSANWSGATITSHGDAMLVQVSGVWVVQAPKLPPVALPWGSTPGPFKYSAWVGLDGQRSFYRESLPQIGIEHDIDPGTGAVQVRAWFQWYALDYEANGQAVPYRLDRKYIRGIPVSAGDHVAVMLCATATNRASAYIHNRSTGLAAAVLDQQPPDVAASATTLRPAVGGQVGSPAPEPIIYGTTAEWVVERMARTSRAKEERDTGLEQFAAFDPVLMESCIAGAALKPGQAAFGRDLKAARLLRLFARTANGDATVFRALPRIVDQQTLEVRYGDKFFGR